MDEEFEWNEDKAASNFLKHGVTFEEAETVFDDDLAMIEADSEHSIDEDRYRLLGYSSQSRLLYVVYTERDGRPRPISARVATPRERRNYEQSNLY